MHRRHVFYIAGYDPVSPEQFYQRFLRQLKIFADTWNVQSSASPMSGSASNPIWTVTSKGENWATETVFEYLAWDDLIARDTAGSRLVRLARTLATYGNLLVTGTLFRYAAANLRYFAFTLVPLLQLILLACVAGFVAFKVVALIGLPSFLAYPLMALLGIGGLLALLEWPGRRWRTYQAFDDWIMSLDYIYERRRDLDVKIAQFSDRIAACVLGQKADEIVIVGHSLGATFAIDAAARAADMVSASGGRTLNAAIVTLGATIPKCVLHPAAGRIRGQVAKIVGDPNVSWVEYQMRADAISFYRFHPVTLRRLSGSKESFEGKPVIRSVQIHNMLRPETFKKFRYRVLRLHYQAVSANDLRAPYDFYMMICGPLRVRNWTSAENGLLKFFSEQKGSRVADPAR